MPEDNNTPAHGDGDSAKTDDGNGSSNEITVNDLTDKFRDGRSEGVEKGVKDTLNQINTTLDTDFNSLDDLKSGLTETIKGSVEESEVVQQLQEKLKSKDQKIQNLGGKIQDFRVSGTRDKQIQEALGDKSLKIDKGDALTLFKNQYGYEEKDGELFAVNAEGERFLTDDGNFATVGDAFYRFAKDKNLLAGNATGGTGGRTGASNRSGSTENPFLTGNKTEQAKLYRKDKELFQRMKQEAQSKS